MNAHPRFGLMSLTLLAALLFSSFIAARQVQANSSANVNISVFHDALAPYGNWVNHRTYGQVWYPRNVARDWRPYTDGYWAHTHDYGWLWVSYEPWGWAPFHYGRWAWDNWYGWVWVPGRIWAPAWVFWRSGGGYAAWAPMPPNAVWQPGIGLNISYFNYDRDLSWDSWVAVREYDLPNRHINRHIFPQRQNREVINVTNYTNNVTLINNTIVNQGVPVKQIEQVTRKPVVSVVPKVHDRMDINTVGHNNGQPNIIRLPMAAPTPEEIQHNEELARRLDGKKPDGTRTELLVVNSRQPGNQKPRLPGRLAGAPAPIQSPYSTSEQSNPALTEPVEQAQPLSGASLLGLNPDSDTLHNEPQAGGNPDVLVSTQLSDQKSSATIQPIVPVSPQVDGVSAPVPVIDQQPVSTDAAPMPLLQNERQPLEPAKQPNQSPLVYQQQIERRQAESLQRQKQIDQLQQELAVRQDKQKKQQIEMQHQTESVRHRAARQQEIQNQQQLEKQRQQAERAREEAQQMQQQEAARQRETQSQQQLEVQRQQPERAREEAQQMQQQEEIRQRETQNQQQLEKQRQQAERAREEAQQMQQQEETRWREIQNQQQQQQEKQRQQAERAREEAQQMQQQEETRQREIQNQQQQQQEKQRQQAERAREEVQQMQQQEAARQRETQSQQQLEVQRQQAERAREEAQQMQQQQAARQRETQSQQQLEVQRQQPERAREEVQQMQQQEAARQRETQNQQQLEKQRQQAERAREEAQQMQQQEAARQRELQNQQQLEKQRQQTERAREEAQQMQRQLPSKRMDRQ